MTETYEIDFVEVIHETDRALLIDSPETGEVWVPKSQIADHSYVQGMGDCGSLFVTLWFAKQQGWF